MFLYHIGMELFVAALYMFILFMFSLSLIATCITNVIKREVKRKWRERTACIHETKNNEPCVYSLPNDV